MVWFVLVVLSLGFLVQLVFRKLRGRLATAFFCLYLGSILFVVGTYLFVTYMQYIEWSNPASLTKYLVPPYRSAIYVFQYHFTRFLLYYLVSFLVSAAFLFLSWGLNKRRGGVFFEKEETVMGALAIFVLGFAEREYLWMWYLIALFGIYALVHFSLNIAMRKMRIYLNTGNIAVSNKRDVRIPMYWLWLPVGLGVILIRLLVV